jgi:hypothetical protein
LTHAVEDAEDDEEEDAEGVQQEAAEGAGDDDEPSDMEVAWEALEVNIYGVVDTIYGFARIMTCCNMSLWSRQVCRKIYETECDPANDEALSEVGRCGG